MSIDLPIILFNLYYIGVAVAFLIREILWLRTVMIMAGSCVIAYGALTHNSIIIFWNTIFVCINTFQVVRLILERRPVAVDADIADIYRNVFPAMTPQEFLRFWHMGSLHSVEDEKLCTQGIIQSHLLLVINGNAGVIREGHEIALLGRGSFVAEMGFITQKPASATVMARGRADYIAWSRKKLTYMEKAEPQLYNKLQFILSRDLVHKLEKHQ
ncbi:MAG: cyclic nucleotide-binding domain-containing protein [Spirochaetes bacterium]|nr:cyclic nucleotide-binding domain-containing protein [Spirochaetota bacterium]